MFLCLEIDKAEKNKDFWNFDLFVMKVISMESFQLDSEVDIHDL